MKTLKILLLFLTVINFGATREIAVSTPFLGDRISLISEKISSKFNDLLDTVNVNVKKREINFDEFMPNYDDVISEFSEKLTAIKNSINPTDPDKGTKLSDVFTQIKGSSIHIIDGVINLLTKFYVVIPTDKSSLAVNAAVLGAVHFLFGLRLGAVKVLDNAESFLDFLGYK